MLGIFKGFLIGIVVFLTIGICHPLVIKVEYHIGRKVWWVFLALAIIFMGASLFVSQIYSLGLGVIGAAFLWSSIEVRWQHVRACRGRAKQNPKRPAEYYSLEK